MFVLPVPPVPGTPSPSGSFAPPAVVPPLVPLELEPPLVPEDELEPDELEEPPFVPELEEDEDEPPRLPPLDEPELELDPEETLPGNAWTAPSRSETSISVSLSATVRRSSVSEERSGFRRSSL